MGGGGWGLFFYTYILTIEHVYHHAGRLCVAGYAGVISAVAQSRLCNEQLARRAALSFLRLQGNAAPADFRFSKHKIYYI